MRTLQSRYGLLLLGVGLGFVSWFIDSCADWIWFAKSETFWGVLLPDEPVEVWMRFLVMVICGILGYLAQQAFNRQRALMIALERSNVELAAAKEAAEISNRTKSAFLANVSHELRTPMHAVLSFAELGRDRCGQLSEEKTRQYFGSIHDSGSRLLVLLNDLLDISKIEAGRMEFHFEETSIHAMIDTACEESRMLLAGKRLQLVRPAPQEARVYADRQRLGQVLRNLLSNAIKFSSPNGEIRFELGHGIIHPQPAGQATRPVPAFALRISDEGVGIPEDEIEKIFEKFTQGSTTLVSGGTGLGLAIVREIIAAHGGSVRAYNRHTRGATFEILLPAITGEHPGPALQNGN